MQDQTRLPDQSLLSNPEDNRKRPEATKPVPVVIHSDKIDNWVKIISAAFTLVAIFLAIMEYSESTDQRIKELRFQQAQVGKELLDEALLSEEVQDAMRMLDRQDPGVEFEIAEGKAELITTSDIIQALSLDEDTDSKKDVFIQDRVESLFFFIGRIQAFIDIGMVNEEDVLYPLEYYVQQMCDYKDNISPYVRTYSSKQTLTFLNNRWNNCVQANK